MDTGTDLQAVDVWVRDAQRGDAAAFDRLARHFLPRIRRWALVRTGDPDDADDVVQRTLVQMYRKLDRFRGDAAFGSWLYRIVGNTALELFRRRRSRTEALERLSLEPQDPEDAPSADDDGTLALLRSFLGDLSRRQREMMELVDFQDHTPAEAADLLGLNANTARVHLLRARREIRRRILAEHPELVEDLR